MPVWTSAPSAIIDTPEQSAFLDAFAAKLAFAPYVTSGTRSSLAQARAMFTKIQLGGLDELLRTYRDDTFAREVFEAHPDTAVAAEIIDRYKAAGQGSAHLRGLSVDVRTRDRSEADIAAMIAATEQLGATPFREYNPPHLHITIPAGFGTRKEGANPKLLIVPIALGIFAILAVNKWG